MADQMYISLKICGNPESNGGFQPILLFNNPLIEILDKFDSGFEANSYYFSLKIEQTQTVYKLIKNNVRSYGSIRAGSLVFGISIPKGYQLDGGLTPFDALTTIKEAFLQRCMTCRDTVKETYEFNPGRVDSGVLNDVVQRFVLVPCQTAWHPMTDGAPVGCVIRPENDILQLLSDVQYPEFEQFCEVLIAEKTTSTPSAQFVMLNNLAIPRVAQYKVYLNQRHQETVSDPQKRLSYKIQETATQEGAVIEFSIEQLKNGEYFPEIAFDPVNEIVNVMLTPRDKTVNYQLTVQATDADFSGRLQFFSLKFRGKSKAVDSNGNFALVGDEITNVQVADFQVTYRGNDYDIQQQTLTPDHTLKVVMVPHTTQLPNTQRAGQSVQQSPVSRVISVELQLPHDFEFGKSIGSDHSLMVKIFKDGNEQTAWRTKFTKSATPQRQYHGEVLIPKDWMGNTVSFNISYGNYDYDSGEIIVPRSDENITVKLHPLKKNFMDSVVYSNMKVVMLILGLLLGLFLGSIIGYATHDSLKQLLNPPTKHKTAQQTVVDEDAEVEQTAPVGDNELKEKLNEYEQTLKQEDLSFQQIDDIYNYYKENEPKVKALNPQLAERIEDYKKVSEAVQSGDPNKNNVWRNARDKNLKIEKKHNDKLFAFFAGALTGKPTQYSEDERTKRFAQFKANHANYQSFADLVYERETSVESTPQSTTLRTTEQQVNSTQLKNDR